MALRLDDNLAMVILRELLTTPYTHAHTSKGDNFSLVRDLDEKLCNELCEPAIIEAQPSLDAAFQGFGDKFVPSQCLGLGYKGWIAATGFGVVCKMAVRFLTGPVRGLPPRSIPRQTARSRRFHLTVRVSAEGGCIWPPSPRVWMPKVKARAIINDCIANGENDQVARWAKEEFARRGSVLPNKRAELQKRLASDELSEPERAETQQKLDKVQARIMKGPETLKTERAELHKQLAEQDLAPAASESREEARGGADEAFCRR